MAKPKEKPAGLPSAKQVAEIERRIGQYCVAFGCGAGDIRTPRTVIQALRDRHGWRIALNVATRPNAWKTEAVHVLAYMRTAGRLAAGFATDRGSLSVSPDEFNRAMDIVEKAAMRDHPRNLFRTFGKNCPIGN